MADEPTMTGHEAASIAARAAGIEPELVAVIEWTCPAHEYGPHSCDCELCPGCPSCATATWRQRRDENGRLVFRERGPPRALLDANIAATLARPSIVLAALHDEPAGVSVRVPIIRAAKHDRPAA